MSQGSICSRHVKVHHPGVAHLLQVLLQDLSNQLVGQLGVRDQGQGWRVAMLWVLQGSRTWLLGALCHHYLQKEHSTAGSPGGRLWLITALGGGDG